MLTNSGSLTIENFEYAIKELASRDSDLAYAINRWGNPPFWTYPSDFSGIVIIILTQQVSLESAKSTFAKLTHVLRSVTPAQFLSLDSMTLKNIGFSRQKAAHARGIAQAIVNNHLDLKSLETMDNQAARDYLVAFKGIGLWTADTYLLFSLCREDIWPSADLALLRAIQDLKCLPTIPVPEEGDTLAQSWRPWRSVAARILWYHYLCLLGRISPDK